jgi:aldehyde:ferredoxin oxidoreductase
MNNHTLQNFHGNGLPNSAANPLKLAIAQEIACSKRTYFQAEDESAQGKWAWSLQNIRTPMNKARAGLAAQCLISYELENSLTACNYTLPVWASPLKSRNNAYTDAQGNAVGGEPHYLSVIPPEGTTPIPTPGYRGDPELDVKVFNAVTGQNLTFAEYEKLGHKMFTLWRVYTARIMNARKAGAGADMRTNFDQAPAWAFDPANAVAAWGALQHDDWELTKDLVYEALGYAKETGVPTEAKLVELGLGDLIPTLKGEGVLP